MNTWVCSKPNSVTNLPRIQWHMKWSVDGVRNGVWFAVILSACLRT